MWRPSATGPYARVGRFFPTYGLRLVEHIFYMRRFTGNALYEEPYALSGGYIADDWEVHASGFTAVPSSFPDFFQSIGHARIGRHRLRRDALRRHGGAGAAGARRHRRRRGALPGRRHRQGLDRSGEADVPGRGRRDPPADQGQHRPDAVRVVRRADLHSDPRADGHGWPTSGTRKTWTSRTPATTRTIWRSTSSPGRTSSSSGSGACSTTATAPTRRWVCFNSTTTYDGGEIQSARDRRRRVLRRRR